MIFHCSHCNTTTPLETAVEDNSARQFFGKAKELGEAFQPMVVYLGLFKPRKQALRWSRALSLTEQVQQLASEVDNRLLSIALVETVEAKREDRQQPNWEPFSSHNYLRSVLKTVAARDHSPVKAGAIAASPNGAPQSKTAKAIDALNKWQGVSKHDNGDQIPDWFWYEIAYGLAGWYLQSLEGAPPADLVIATAERWVKELWPKRPWHERHHRHNPQRLRLAFKQAGQGSERWPTTSAVLGQIPEV